MRNDGGASSTFKTDDATTTLYQPQASQPLPTATDGSIEANANTLNDAAAANYQN